MKRYFKNLLAAVCGKNPYRQELDKVKEDMCKAAANVSILQESFYREQEKAAECKKLMNEYKSLLTESDKQLTSFKTLTENLRDRIKDYQKRIEAYNKELDKLQQKADKKA